MPENPPKDKASLKVCKKDLQLGLPPVIKDKYDGVNVVLALLKDDQYCASNLYIPKWTVVNTLYYIANAEDYEGWVELEDLNPPEELLQECYGKK